MSALRSVGSISSSRNSVERLSSAEVSEK